jgi:hypothetical protein
VTHTGGKEAIDAEASVGTEAVDPFSIMASATRLPTRFSSSSSSSVCAFREDDDEFAPADMSAAADGAARTETLSLPPRTVRRSASSTPRVDASPFPALATREAPPEHPPTQ